jgi:hypothetical protein
MKINANLAISDTGFIFNPSNGDSFSTNSAGAYIIQLMKDGLKHDEIKKRVCDKYNVDASTVEKDLEDFILQMQDYFLINNE